LRRWLDIIWPTLEKPTAEEVAGDTAKAQIFASSLERLNLTSEFDQLALDAARRIEADEGERKRSAEVKASHVLLVIAALIPLLTYLETAIWDAKLGTAPKWLTLLILLTAVAF
jgi:hypothetical protein